MRIGRAGDPIGGGGEQHPMSTPGSDDPQCGREMGFSGPGWSEQHDVAGLGEKTTGGQHGELLPDRRLGIEVEVVEGFAGIESCGTDAQFGAGGVASGDFPFKDGGEIVLERPAGIAGLIGQPDGDVGDARGFSTRPPDSGSA